MKNGLTSSILRAAESPRGLASGELGGFDVHSVSAVAHQLVRKGRLSKINGRFYVTPPSDLQVAAPRVPLVTERIDPEYRPRAGSMEFAQHPSRYGNTLIYRDGRRESTTHAVGVQA